MKILHLVTQDYGGAGRAAYRIFTGIRSLGHDVKMLVLNKNSNDPDVHVLHENSINGSYTTSPEQQYISQRYQDLWREWFQLMNSFPERPSGLEIFTDTRSFTNFINSPEVMEADILNFHWMAGFINFEEIANLLPDKPIVWTLHDMNPFTGGCHYAGDCTKYKNECGACPQLGSKKQDDISSSVWKIKNETYKNLNINVLTPSKWLGDCARESSLFGRFPVHVIANGFPLDKYFPKNRESLRTNLNIPLNQKVILFGADNILNERKGLKYFLHALSQLVAKRKDIGLAFFGHFHEDFKIPFEVPVYQFGSVSDEMKLSAIYSLADVFVIPSLEDNLPNTVVESMASGTPVVGFNIGGIPDMVENGITGMTAIPRDIDDLAKSIEKVIDAPNYQKMRENCWAKAQKEYSLKGQAQKYVDLYKSILKAMPKKEPREVKTVNINLTKPKLPKISVVTPSFNQGEYIEECIDSVLSQGYPDLEYVIMDGGSTDGSVDIIKKYEKYLKFWKTGKDAGQYAAINEGFTHTTGEVMTWLNSDDIFYPDSFFTAGSIFSNNPGIDWLTGRASMINHEGKMDLLNFRRWGAKDLLGEDYRYIQQEGTYWRRELWEKSGGKLDTDFTLAADFELWSRFFRHAQLQSVVFLSAGFRKHPGQRSEKYEKEYEAQVKKIVKRERGIISDINKLPEPDPAFITTENTFIKPGNEEFFANEIARLKSAVSLSDTKNAKIHASRSAAFDVGNSELRKIYAGLYKLEGKSASAKAILWNGIFRHPHESLYYKLLFEMELEEKRVDNLKDLLRIAHEYGVNFPEFDKVRENAEYFWQVLSLCQNIKLNIDAGNTEIAGQKFNELAIKIGDKYLFKEDVEYTFEEVKNFTGEVFVLLENSHFEKAIEKTAKFFNVEIQLLL